MSEPSSEILLPSPRAEIAKAEEGKPMFTDEIAARVNAVLGGKINTIRVVEPLRENFGRTIHEIDTSYGRLTLENRDDFNRAEGEGANGIRFTRIDPETGKLPDVLEKIADFSMHDLTGVEIGETLTGKPSVNFIQKGSTHTIKAALGQRGSFRVSVNRNPSK